MVAVFRAERIVVWNPPTKAPKTPGCASELSTSNRASEKEGATTLPKRARKSINTGRLAGIARRMTEMRLPRNVRTVTPLNPWRSDILPAIGPAIASGIACVEIDPQKSQAKET
jgi:hypothetical protein